MSTNKNSLSRTKNVFWAIRHSRLILLCCVVSIQSAHAQVNLVVDPSMENYLRCPTSTTENEGCYTWHSLDSITNTPNALKSCTPIYLNTCAPSFLGNSCPQNYAQGYSYMYPRTGNGMYMNVFYCDPVHCSGYYYRDHLRGRIRGHLANGEQYCGKYYVSLYKSVMYGIDRLGAYVDNGALDANNECSPIVAPPAFENPVFNYITDTTGWTKIEGIFTANGTESYITIGNFYSHANTHKVIFNAASMFEEGLYYVDDVSIIPVNITAFAGHDVSICLSDSIALGRPQEIGLECEWYIPGNAVAFNSGSQFTFKPKQTGTYSFIQKMDNCRITYDTVTVTVVEDCNSLLVIPNVFTPNEDGTNDSWHFEVKEASNLSYSIYNRWGNLLKSVDLKGTTLVSWDGRTTSGEACTAGVYFYVLSYTDAKGAFQKRNGYISLIK